MKIPPIKRKSKYREHIQTAIDKGRMMVHYTKGSEANNCCTFGKKEFTDYNFILRSEEQIYTVYIERKEK